jgi:hypothetical protein
MALNMALGTGLYIASPTDKRFVAFCISSSYLVNGHAIRCGAETVQSCTGCNKRIQGSPEKLVKSVVRQERLQICEEELLAPIFKATKREAIL